MQENSSKWIPLHLHSQYSILDATTAIAQIAEKAKAYGMTACALTDHGNLFGAIDFYKACKANKIKPILGCEVYVAPKSRFEKKKGEKKSAYHLVLLAKNIEGFHNLMKLSSLAYTEGFYYHPRIDKELLLQHKEGLICLSGCMSGMIATLAYLGAKEELCQEIEWYKSCFGEDYYIEIQRHKMSKEDLDQIEDSIFLHQYEECIEKQEKINPILLEMAEHYKIKYVATNDTHYLEKKDWLAHEILLNIQSGDSIEIVERDSMGNAQFRKLNPKRRLYATRELYFKSQDEMAQQFSDLPLALSNTLEVAEKCNLKLDFDAKHYPSFVPPKLVGVSFTVKEREEEVAKLLRSMCEEAIEKRYSEKVLKKISSKYPSKDPINVIKERLDYELGIILSKGMGDYLLIVWDIIHWAKSHGIAVGPGRGSGAGSIILYLIGITDIEPLSLSLFFERFINPERISYPDIDVDICMERRSKVVDYVLKRYGKESVAQIITFGTMKAKMAIRDVGRVLSIPLTKVNQLIKLIPDDPTLDLNSALASSDLKAVYEEDAEVKRIIDLAKALEGSIRNLGTHAAGFIISPGNLMDHIPICVVKDSEIVATQFSMKPVESIGMLKIDLLGLKTLTALEYATESIREGRGEAINWRDLDLEDKATFSLLQQGKCLGVFQLESGGIQDLAKQLRPDCFEDIIAIVALYRPGPMEMIPSFINRKHKREPIEYDHHLLEPILRETYGVMVYQEQVMHIAEQLAGYSLGEGDILRRAMGKKDHDQMQKEREKFCQGAVKKGIERNCAEAIFDKMEKFASYGFNKSHAAAYAYLTYSTAYLKAHYTPEWMAALMTCDSDDIEKVSKWIRECMSLSIPMLPPDINESSKRFIATPRGIRFAMSAIKGIGEGVVDLIVRERKERGPYKSLFDFFKRIDLTKVGKKTIEGLVWAGCFDFTGWSRDALVLSIEEMHDHLFKSQKEEALGIMSLFSLVGGDTEEGRFLESPKVLKSTSRLDLLKREKELLGFYLTGHPMEAYLKDSNRLGVIAFSELEKLEHQAAVRLAFIVEGCEIKQAIKSQKKFAILTASDGIMNYPLFVFFDLFEEKAAFLEENRLLYAVVTVDKREENLRLTALWLEDLTKVSEKSIKEADVAYDKAKRRSKVPFLSKPKSSPQELPQIVLKVNLRAFRLSYALRLKELLQKHKGQTSVRLEFFQDEKKHSTLYVDKNLSVNDSSELIHEIEAIGAFQRIS